MGLRRSSTAGPKNLTSDFLLNRQFDSIPLHDWPKHTEEQLGLFGDQQGHRTQKEACRRQDRPELGFLEERQAL